jgi:hypothetical protein
MDMDFSDITLTAFTLCNSIRVVGYVPQILKAATDDNGAKAISHTTWGLFLASHLSTAAYAAVNQADWTMAAIFLVNAVGSAAILAAATWRRLQHDKRGSMAPARLSDPRGHCRAAR